MWELNESTHFLNDLNYTFGNLMLCTATDSWPSITVEIVVYIFILVSSLAGNVLVVVIFFRNKTFTETTVNYFIMNMSVSDLMVPAISLPVWIIITYDKSLLLSKGAFSTIVCGVSWVVWGVSVLVSLFSMTALAADRFRAVLYPFKPALFSQRKLCVTIAAMWVSSIAYFVYYAIFVLPIDASDTFCEDIEWTSQKFLLQMIFFALICFSVVVVTIFYSKLTIFFYRQKNSLHLASEEVKKRAKRNRKITTMLIIIVILFYVVWIPFYVMMFLSLTNILFPCWFFWVTNYILPILHPAINPLIYFVFNEKYRQGLKEIFLRGVRVRNKESNNDFLPNVAPQSGITLEHGKVNEAMENIELQEQ